MLTDIHDDHGGDHGYTCCRWRCECTCSNNYTPQCKCALASPASDAVATKAGLTMQLHMNFNNTYTHTYQCLIGVKALRCSAENRSLRVCEAITDCRQDSGRVSYPAIFFSVRELDQKVSASVRHTGLQHCHRLYLFI